MRESPQSDVNPKVTVRGTLGAAMNLKSMIFTKTRQWAKGDRQSANGTRMQQGESVVRLLVALPSETFHSTNSARHTWISRACPPRRLDPPVSPNGMTRLELGQTGLPSAKLSGQGPFARA